MARQRVLKPDFFTDEDLARCTVLARLLFAGLWTLADRRGRLRDQPPVIHGALFPFEAEVNVDALLGELARGGFVQRYEFSGKRFLQIRNFEKHQNPHPKEAESVIPAPGSAVESNGSAVEKVRPSNAESESESESESDAARLVERKALTTARDRIRKALIVLVERHHLDGQAELKGASRAGDRTIRDPEMCQRLRWLQVTADRLEDRVESLAAAGVTAPTKVAPWEQYQ
jgi:hypothetical protein